MATSQNNWPIVGKSACDQGPFEGVVFPNGILKGDVAVIARWQLKRYVATVEPIKAGTCWGWFVKKIAGSEDYSNHSSATAWDINATRHQQGVAPSHSFSTAQIRACHQIEADSHGTLRWGGNFSNPDGMHWEIIGSRTEVAAFAAWIKVQEEDEMASVQDALNAVNGDIVDDDSGIHRNLVSLVTETAPSVVYGDMSRGPNSPAGQSGLNLFLANTINAALAPVVSRLAAAEAELAALKAGDGS